MKIIRKLERLRRLRRFEWGILLAVTMLLPAVSVSLRVVGLRQTRRWLDAPLLRRIRLSYRPSTSAIVEDYVRMVGIAAANSLFPAKCLSRSLVTKFLLNRQGICTELCVGTRMRGGFEAHAWLELNGVVLNDSPDVQKDFLPLQPKTTG